jgi:hypothetical protein
MLINWVNYMLNWNTKSMLFAFYNKRKQLNVLLTTLVESENN